MLLALALCFALCACGTTDTPEKEHQQTPTESEAVISENNLALGEEIALDFVKIRFDSVKLGYSVGGKGFSTTAQDDMQLFYLSGSIQNVGGSNIPVGNLNAEMTFNGQYTYTARATITDSMTYPVSVAPLTTEEYILYAEIPETLLEMLNTCVVRFSFNDGFASYPESVDSGDHTFEIILDEDSCQAVLQASSEAFVFFTECPILPTPENYAPVYQSSSSSSSFNGKVSAIHYRFTQMPGRNDDLNSIYATYISALQAAGFTLANETASSCDIYSAVTKLASVSVDGNCITLEIVPGNENVAAPEAGNDTSEQMPIEESVLTIGDTIQTDYVCLTLEKSDSASEIRSGTSQYGSYSYYTSDNGDPYFYLFGTFKNLNGTPVDIRNMYLQFCFDETYNYRGEVAGVSNASNGFINDVSPLAEVNYYIYTAVPQELIDTFSTCTIKIGFTENFDYKVIDVNDLPKFENCDDVFFVTIPGQAA